VSVERGQDRCSECKTPLPNESPCPCCGSTKRTVPLSVQAVVEVSGSVNRKLIIGWPEVERLLAKEESAAALLVAAVNVEFILWENLRRLPPSSPPSKKSHYSEWKTWRSVEKDDRDSVGLGSLIQLAQFFVDSKQLTLTPPLKSLGWPLNEVRKRIAHERDFFARLTRLEEADWPETRIRQILEDAKAFCHSNVT
jgi:hypothetical protein